MIGRVRCAGEGLTIHGRCRQTDGMARLGESGVSRSCEPATALNAPQIRGASSDDLGGRSTGRRCRRKPQHPVHIDKTQLTEQEECPGWFYTSISRITRGVNADFAAEHNSCDTQRNQSQQMQFCLFEKMCYLCTVQDHY